MSARQLFHRERLHLGIPGSQTGNGAGRSVGGRVVGEVIPNEGWAGSRTTSLSLELIPENPQFIRKLPWWEEGNSARAFEHSNHFVVNTAGSA